MAYELRSSFMIYFLIVVTSSFTTFNRNLLIWFLFAYCWYVDVDVLIDLPFLTGALLADLSLSLAANNGRVPSVKINGPLRHVRNHWAMILFIFSLLVASYPPSDYEMRPWSLFMHQVGQKIFPRDCIHPLLFKLTLGEFWWAFPWASATLLIFSIHFSPFLRRLFSHPFAVFLGSISFPLYLIHSILMRSVLVWVIYGIIPESDGIVARLSDFEGTRPPISLLWSFVVVCTFASWLALVIYLSKLWRDKLDGQFVKLSSWMEDLMLGKVHLLSKRQIWKAPLSLNHDPEKGLQN
jgi:peptidoglycan/LPS O-acetylase OafA/YrhL